MKLTTSKLTINQLMTFMMWARGKDLLECKLMTDKEFKDSQLNWIAEAECLYDEDTNEVYAIGGVDDNIIWMLCTYKVEQHPVAFLRFCKEYLKAWKIKYGRMSNWVWLGNDLHVKWLKWMGAKFDFKTTVNDEPFHHFYFDEKE